MTLQGTTFSGSGFFLRSDRNLFFVTASHVLRDPTTTQFRAKIATIEALSPNPTEREKSVFDLDLAVLLTGGELKIDSPHDVAVVRIGSIVPNRLLVPSGVVGKGTSAGGIVAAPQRDVFRFAQVFVPNPVVVFGYPLSIGISNNVQIDFGRPLLRSGIVAGFNQSRNTIIIDAAVNGGNSGGPVVMRSPSGSLHVIGVVIEYVPILEDSVPPATQKVQANSGYGVLAAMDAVLDLSASLDQR